MEENNKKPKIRFKGFTEAWEQRKFGDVGYISMCKRIFKNETTEKGEVPFYKIGTFGEVADAFISKEKYEFYKSKFAYPNKGDILLSASGTIGRIVEYNGEKAYFQDSNIVWLNHNSSIINSFLKVLYPTVKWEGIEGSTIKRLYNSNFLNTEFYMPSNDEQEKIGKIFDRLDNLITLHQRKYGKLVNVKKSLLEKMFPKNDSNVPEIRFKGFTEAWEQRKFSNIFEYERPDKYIVNSDEYVEISKTPVLTANKAFILGYTLENNVYKKEKESIIFDDFTLDTKFVDFPYMVKSSAIKILTLKNKLTDNLRYNYELLSNTKFNMLGHARHYISVVQPEEVYTTKKQEQDKMANLFSNLDNLITLHQCKLFYLFKLDNERIIKSISAFSNSCII